MWTYMCTEACGHTCVQRRVDIMCAEACGNTCVQRYVDIHV